MTETIDPRPPYARLCERVLVQELRDYESLFGHARAAADDPIGGSLWANDREHAAGNDAAERSLLYAAEQFTRLMGAIEDHAETLLLLLRHERLLILPSWTTARAILEAVMVTCWLTDPDVSADMRIARAASLLPGVFQGSIEQLGRFPGREGELEDKREALSDLVEYYERHDITVSRRFDKARQVQTDEIAAVHVNGCKAALSSNLTQLAHKYMPGDGHLYGFLSGATHSMPWLLNGLNADSADEALRSIMVPLMPISEAYTRAVGTYLALDVSAITRRRETRVLALLRSGDSLPVPNDKTRHTAFGPIGKVWPDELGSS